MKLLNDFIKRKEKDLKELIKLLPKLEKISNSYIKADIETIISERIISESRQIKELKKYSK